MYIPKHFEVTDEDEKFSFIENNGFGQLISTVEGRLFSTHIPFLLSEDKTKLFAHVAKNNPQVNEVENSEALISLQGEHDYISPNWFTDSLVPTWNYQAVHIYGRCKVLKDLEENRSIVDALTQKYESKLPSPWVPEYKSAMLNAIVGLEIEISEVQCKYKLSQNRSEESRQQIAEQLRENGSVKLADAMRKNI